MTDDRRYEPDFDEPERESSELPPAHASTEAHVRQVVEAAKKRLAEGGGGKP